MLDLDSKAVLLLSPFCAQLTDFVPAYVCTSVFSIPLSCTTVSHMWSWRRLGLSAAGHDKDFLSAERVCTWTHEFAAFGCMRNTEVSLWVVHARFWASLSPRRPAGQPAAACLTAHCACLRHLPWLLDVGGGEGLQQGREDPNGSQGLPGSTKTLDLQTRWKQFGAIWAQKQEDIYFEKHIKDVNWGEKEVVFAVNC